MIKWIIITGGVACLAATLLAQDANPPTFRAGADLIEISVTATHDGDPVLDLTKDDFWVRDKGNDQEIQFFLAPSAKPGDSSSETPETGTGLASESGAAAIVLDWLNTGFVQQVYARQKMLDMLEAIDLNDHVAVFANLRTLEVLHDFTDNNAALLESLAALRPFIDGPSSAGYFGAPDMIAFAAADARIRVDATKRNIRPVLDRLRQQPGRKSLIWVSNSFGALPLPELIRSNITLYLVDARGLQVKPLPPPGPLPRHVQTQLAFREELELSRRLTNRIIAESTGGVYFENRNDLDGAMREALDETRTSYTLGYYLPQGAKPGEHKVQIDVKRRGVKLRYRKSYIVEPPPEQ